MRSIDKVFSHINLIQKENKPSIPDWSKALPLEEILASAPKKVMSYDELVKDVAQIFYRNRKFVLFFRGQPMEFLDEQRTTILPSIYRKKPGENRLMLKSRFEELHKKVDELRRKFRESEIKYAGTGFLNKYPEISWSLLQHYEVCGTPLLDVSQSLHVACSFAFDKNPGNSAIIYVLGLPWQTDAIGYNSYEELVNIRLLSVCPPQAQRPFFQEGFLIGPFPNYQLDNPRRIKQFDFARRLIAKFEIIKSDNFWGQGFSGIPHDKLYQLDDPIKSLCDQIKGS